MELFYMNPHQKGADNFSTYRYLELLYMLQSGSRSLLIEEINVNIRKDLVKMWERIMAGIVRRGLGVKRGNLVKNAF